MRNVILLFLLFPLLAMADLPELMAHLSSLSHPSRQFIEKRYSSLLSQDISTQGTLHYDKNRLTKTITKPFFRRFTIEGNELLIESEDGLAGQYIQLNEHPPLLAFVNLFHATLNGDLSTLQQNYLIDLHEDAMQWKLTLRPRAANVAVHLRQIIIEGNKLGMKTVRIDEQNGDNSLLILDEAIE